MSYIPALWLLIFLVRLLVRAVSGDGSGLGGPAGSAGGEGRELGFENFACLLTTTLIGLPLVVSLAVWAGGLRLPGLVLFLLVLLALVGGLYAVFALPHWLAWRVLGPWGLPRAGHGLLIVASFLTVAARKGSRELFRARFGGEWSPAWQPVNPWTIAASALHADRLAERRRAAVLFGLFDWPQVRQRSWRRPATIAAETLAWSALRRGDWQQASGCTARRLGRGLWLPRQLAALQRGERVGTFRLVLAWLCGPGRIGALPFLRSALAGLSAGARHPPEAALVHRRSVALPSPQDEGPPRAHLAFLAHAAAGGTLRTRELERLSEAWTARLEGEAANAGLLRRALELGAQEVSPLPGELRAALVAELETLADQAEGDWTAGEGTLAADLRQRALGQAFEMVEREIRDFDTPENEVADSRPMGRSLEELERWLGFRDAVWQVFRRGGLSALQSLWFGGLRHTACNWGVLLVRQRGDDATWAAFLMHSWCTDLANRVGDEEILNLSQGNASLTRARLG